MLEDELEPEGFHESYSPIRGQTRFYSMLDSLAGLSPLENEREPEGFSSYHSTPKSSRNRTRFYSMLDSMPSQRLADISPPSSMSRHVRRDRYNDFVRSLPQGSLFDTSPPASFASGVRQSPRRGRYTSMIDALPDEWLANTSPPRLSRGVSPHITIPRTRLHPRSERFEGLSSSVPTGLLVDTVAPVYEDLQDIELNPITTTPRRRVRPQPRLLLHPRLRRHGRSHSMSELNRSSRSRNLTGNNRSVVNPGQQTVTLTVDEIRYLHQLWQACLIKCAGRCALNILHSSGLL